MKWRSTDDYGKWVSLYGSLDDPRRSELRLAYTALHDKPVISVVVPVYNAPLGFLELAVASVRSQLYPHWELCIADDASSRQEVRAYIEDLATKDDRIKVVFRDTNGHIAQATNSALALASGDFVTFLDQDDLLAEDALYWVAAAASRNPGGRLIYSDEDKVSPQGERFAPYFKPSFNYELLLGQNTICHLAAYRRDLILELGGMRVGTDGAQDHDLALRASEVLRANQVVHIPRVLYHWRVLPGSTALSGAEKPYAAASALKVVRDHLARRGVDATVDAAPEAPNYLRIRYALPEPPPRVSIIVPFRDRVELLRTCVSSVQRLTAHADIEYILVDNGSTVPETASYLLQLAEAPGATVRVIRDESEFNFARLINLGSQLASGEVLCLLNNDIEATRSDWLEELVSRAMQPTVGCVGARLWYPDGRLQHGGIILGIGGVAGHAHKYAPRGATGYFGRAVLAQDVSAVTAACMVVRKSVFDEVEGFDESLAVAFNDVDFCLRVRQAGYRNVWTPQAELVHHESASRGSDALASTETRFMKEKAMMRKRWAELLDDDPAYNPNLSLEREDFGLAWPPRSRTA